MIGAVEAIEEVRRVLVAKTRAIVFDRDDGMRVHARDLDAHVPARARETARVLDEVDEYLVDGVGVAVHIGRLAHHGQLHAALLDQAFHE